jgi:PAS domain S-box-containing protein
MTSRLLDYIDFDSVNTLLEGFCQTTGFVTAILDLEGNVLSKSNWRPICTEFHRTNPGTAENCIISDTILANSMKEGQKYHYYQCLNGLVDVVVPIVIKGEHIANLFSGQFFFEEPDLTFYKRQSVKYGFDESAYLKAIEEVPVVSREKVRTAMDFLQNMTRLISDISMQRLEQIELNETIRKSEEKLREVQELAHLGFWTWDVKTGKVEWSDEVFKIFCLDPKGFTPNIDSILELSPWPEDHQRDQELIRRAIETHSPGTYEQRFLRPDNSIGHYYSTFQGVYDEAGYLVTVVGTVLDITDRKHVEEELRGSEARIRTVFEQANDGIFVISTDGRCLDVNERGLELVGYARDDFQSARVSEFLTPREIERLAVELPVMMAGKPHFSEWELIRRDGSVFTGEVSACRLDDNSFLAIIRDLTVRKQSEKKINDQLIELRRWQDVTLGREQRILEMKAEVNELLAQMGMPPRYANHGK